MKTYHLFISHSWKYSDAYYRLVNLLENYPYFTFVNYSVPQDNPIEYAANDGELRRAISDKMLPCSCVLILAGVYATYSKWINIEIELARKLHKPIIDIEPWGADKTSVIVKDAADKRVGWNTKSIVDAIRSVTY